MIYYLSLMESKLETRLLKELVPSYAARYTDDYWDYCYTEFLSDAIERVEAVNKHDFIEDHTALSDAEIEAQILLKALKKVLFYH